MGDGWGSYISSSSGAVKEKFLNSSWLMEGNTGSSMGVRVGSSWVNSGSKLLTSSGVFYRKIIQKWYQQRHLGKNITATRSYKVKDNHLYTRHHAISKVICATYNPWLERRLHFSTIQFFPIYASEEDVAGHSALAALRRHTAKTQCWVLGQKLWTQNDGTDEFTQEN